mgnify:CR=1 FL=1
MSVKRYEIKHIYGYYDDYEDPNNYWRYKKTLIIKYNCIIKMIINDYENTRAIINVYNFKKDCLLKINVNKYISLTKLTNSEWWYVKEIYKLQAYLDTCCDY